MTDRTQALERALKRARDSLSLCIGELTDPGAEALAALWEANQALALPAKDDGPTHVFHATCPACGAGVDVVPAEDDGWRRDQIGALADRFLAWPLPPSVNSDQCVSIPHYSFPRSGTNLLNADEARQMIEYLLFPAPPVAEPTDG